MQPVPPLWSPHMMPGQGHRGATSLAKKAPPPRTLPVARRILISFKIHKRCKEGRGAWGSSCTGLSILMLQCTQISHNLAWCNAGGLLRHHSLPSGFVFLASRSFGCCSASVGQGLVENTRNSLIFAQSPFRKPKGKCPPTAVSSTQ